MMIIIMSMGENTSLNCGHQSPLIPHEHGEPWWNDVDRGKLLIHLPKTPWQYYQQSHLVAIRRNGWRKWWIWPCEVFCHTWERFFTRCKIFHEAFSFIPPPKEGVLQILSPLKTPSTTLGLNPRTLGLTASTLTITPPRWQWMWVGVIVKQMGTPKNVVCYNVAVTSWTLVLRLDNLNVTRPST
jgi:hypothetical protein